MSILQPIEVVLNDDSWSADWIIAIGTLAAVLVALLFRGVEYVQPIP